jgi:hypothetical protein
VQFVVEGYIDILLAFERDNQLELPLRNGGRFRMPVTLSDLKTQPFSMELNDSSAEATESLALKHLRDIVHALAYQFNAPVYHYAITSVRNAVTGQGFHQTSVGASVAMIKPLNDTSIRAFKSRFPTIARGNTLTSPQSALLTKYADAIKASDNVSAFWDYYAVLQMCLRTERRGVDAHIRRNYTLPVVHNDYKQQDVSIITAIRDAFSHKTATFNGNSLDIERELANHIDDLRQIAEHAIANEL